MLVLSTLSRNSEPSVPPLVFADAALEALFTQLADTVGMPQDGKISISKEPKDRSFLIFAPSGIATAVEEDEQVVFATDMAIAGTELTRAIRVNFLASAPGAISFCSSQPAKMYKQSRNGQWRAKKLEALSVEGRIALENGIEETVRRIAGALPYRQPAKVTYIPISLVSRSLEAPRVS